MAGSREACSVDAPGSIVTQTAASPEVLVARRAVRVALGAGADDGGERGDDRPVRARGDAERNVGMRARRFLPSRALAWAQTRGGEARAAQPMRQDDNARPLGHRSVCPVQRASDMPPVEGNPMASTCMAADAKRLAKALLQKAGLADDVRLASRHMRARSSWRTPSPRGAVG